MHGGKSFSGFPEGKVRLTPVPQHFFAELLPAIDHLGELKVTLYAIWALERRGGRFRCFRREELAADELLMSGLGSERQNAADALDESLERAVSRGTLLKAHLETDDGPQVFYFLNTPKGRAGVKAIADGDWRPGGEAQAAVELKQERPNIFNLYEQNIGPLTPMIAETLREAEQAYPALWIEDAMRIAVENNVRKWRYVQAILDHWQTEGRDDREDRGDTEKARRRYLEGEFADYVEP